MALNFQNTGSALIRRVLFVVFLAVSLVLMTLYAREGEDGVLHSVQDAASGISAPFKFASAAVGSATESAGDATADLTADESTLSGLRESNAELRELLSQADEYKQEAERLQGLLDMKQLYDLDGVAARVVGRNIQAWNQTVDIDVGEADGVDSGMTVMGTSGVVGQVVSVTDHRATIRLLTDPNSGAAALVQSSRAEGVVRGSLDGLLYLENVDVDVEVAQGDVVMTSGTGGSYAKGLIIGTVVKVDAKQGQAARRIVVLPNDKASSLEEVFVVKSVGSDGSSDSNGGGEGDVQ